MRKRRWTRYHFGNQLAQNEADVEILLGAIVLFFAYTIIRAKIRTNYADTMAARRHADQFTQSAMERDEMRAPSWARHDPSSIKVLSSQVKDALISGGVAKEKAARMADNQYVIATALLFAAGYESSGMNKISQIAAAATDIQTNAKTFERHYDGNDWPK